EKVGKKGRFLHSSLSAFGAEDVIDFFESRGVRTKVERGGRVFPENDQAKDVLKAISNVLKENGVTIRTGIRVERFLKKGDRIEKVILASGDEVRADKFVVAVGGKAYPVTGSTGDGYEWAKELGHTVVEASPALVPVKVHEEWAKELQGLSLRNVQINIFQNNKKMDSRFGEMIFTHFGVSGPIVLDVSKKIGELLKNGGVQINLDLKPALEPTQLKERLQRDFNNNPKKSFRNYLPDLLPRKMVDVILKLSEVDPDKQLCVVNGQEKKKLLNLLKDLRMEVDDLLGFEHAIVTAGGVNLKEIHSKTMQSRIVENLYFAGEILDLDAPTGGYNLQICWSTGYAAGSHAAK
ncbi:MAG: NAD(P)/FAD-dependent oxidoreductase, partial [Candidatus Moranbacteria bacterium]|nr:NAD(P)/FAD-dependent oxidoreductase [Candidatus Moranbacteria bacterium]